MVFSRWCPDGTQNSVMVVNAEGWVVEVMLILVTKAKHTTQWLSCCGWFTWWFGSRVHQSSFGCDLEADLVLYELNVGMMILYSIGADVED